MSARRILVDPRFREKRLPCTKRVNERHGFLVVDVLIVHGDSDVQNGDCSLSTWKSGDRSL